MDVSDELYLLLLFKTSSPAAVCMSHIIIVVHEESVRPVMISTTSHVLYTIPMQTSLEVEFCSVNCENAASYYQPLYCMYLMNEILLDAFAILDLLNVEQVTGDPLVNNPKCFPNIVT